MVKGLNVNLIVAFFVAVAFLSAPWGLLLTIVAGLWLKTREEANFFGKATAKLSLALTIGLGVSCLEISVLRLTAWTAGPHQFEVGILHLYYQLKTVEDFFSLTHTVIVLAVLFLVELFVGSWPLTKPFLRFKDKFSTISLVLSVIFSLSCFTQEPLWECAKIDFDDMQFAYNLSQGLVRCVCQRGCR
jgi:hypothetical protein